MLTLLLLLAQVPDSGTPHFDLDGDGLDEVIDGTTESTVRFSRTGKTVTTSLVWEMSPSLDVKVAVPQLPPSKVRADALGYIAARRWPDAELRTTPDASLARLRAQRAVKRKAAAPLVWLDGAPQMPSNYLLRSAGDRQWWFYMGQFHKAEQGKPPTEPWVVAEDETRVILATAHGLILTDPQRTKHAWLYVLDLYVDKLRHPSVTKRVVLCGDEVRFDFSSIMIEAPDRLVMHINLRSGAITEQRTRDDFQSENKCSTGK